MRQLIASLFIATCASFASASVCFDDQEMVLVQQEAQALVYVWSPRMVLSAQHAANVQQKAREQGLRFVAVHDASVPVAEVEAALSTMVRSGVTALINSASSLQKSEPLCAKTLLERDALRHFPSTFVLLPAGLHRQPIVGAMPTQAWASSLAQRVADRAGFEPLRLASGAGNITAAQDSAQSAGANAKQCIAANTFSPLPASVAGLQTDSYGTTRVALGSYERISPDGRFVLRSFSGGKLGEVSLIELNATGQAVAAYDTPLSNEAFPVQGSWRYVVDVNGDHYTFSSLLSSNSKDKRRTKPQFTGGMNGFYAAAAELPHQSGDLAGQVRIRSMSWPNATGNADTQGEGALVARTLTVDTVLQRIVADSGPQRLCAQRVREDGPMYALPMISVDGLEFAALPQTPVQGAQTMRIFGFGSMGHGCEPRDTFSFSSGKTIFGFPQAGASTNTSVPAPAPTPAAIAYEYRGQAWWVLRQANAAASPFNVAPYYANPRTQLLASAFPGITQDGRVIYGATLKTCAAPSPANPNPACSEQPGYVTTDPYQSNAYQAFLQQPSGPGAPPLRKQCITHGDVQRSRAAFAKLHGLAP
jgi:hypothetical protein